VSQGLASSAVEHMIRIARTTAKCAVWFVILLAAEPTRGELLRSDPLCGPLCLCFILRRLDIAYEWESLLRKCEYCAKHGTTLQGLKECAEAYGVHAVGIGGNVQYLATMLDEDTYMIVHRSNHFQVLSKSSGEVYLVDPSMKAVALCAHLIEKDECKGVMISRQPTPLGDRSTRVGRWLRAGGWVLLGAAAAGWWRHRRTAKGRHVI